MIWNRWSSLRSTPPPSPTPALVSFKIYVSLKLGELRIYVSCRITFELWGVCGAPLSSLVLVAAQRRWARDIRQPGNTVLTSGQPGWRLWIQTGSRVPVLTTWWHSRLKKTALPQPKPRKKQLPPRLASVVSKTHIVLKKVIWRVRWPMWLECAWASCILGALWANT